MDDLRINALSLEALIRLKEEAGRAKDRAAVDILRAVLKEKSGV